MLTELVAGSLKNPGVSDIFYLIGHAQVVSTCIRFGTGQVGVVSLAIPDLTSVGLVEDSHFKQPYRKPSERYGFYNCLPPAPYV